MIDGGLREWPQEVREAADLFKQGHLIKNPPFFFGAAPRTRVWGSKTDSGDEGDNAPAEPEDPVLLELEPEDCPPYGMLTSQTCDIGGVSAEKHPWIQVAPVYHVEQAQVDSFVQRLYAKQLTAAGFDDGRWVVDLRVEFPLEKSVLARRKPIEAFADEQGYLELARLLGMRRERAAFADSLVEVVSGGIKSKRADNGDKPRSRRVWARLQSGGLRLSVVEGDRLEPKQARLHVVTRGKADKEVRTWFEEWYDIARAEAEKYGFSLLATEFIDGTRVDAEYYRSLSDLGLV
jgi:hypothetical protein